MSGRPDALFPLFSGLSRLPGIGAKTAEQFRGLGVEVPRDLLFTLPHGLVDRRPRPSVIGAELPATLTVAVTVGQHYPAAGRGRPYRVAVSDDRTTFQVVFFHAHADWVRRQLPQGARRLLSGRVELFDGLARMVHPDHILPEDAADQMPAFEPVYPLAAGLTRRQVARAAGALVEALPDLPEWIDPDLRRRERWPGWRDALRRLHCPERPEDAGGESPARRRTAYDELLAHQLTLALARSRRRRKPGRETPGDGRLRAKLLAALPYAPTGAQSRAAEEIAADLAAPHRMNRLLQGDVGSGKTLVAALALLTAVEAGGQGAFMAPTEILARQHADALAPLMAAAEVRLSVLTGRDRAAARAKTLAGLAAGVIDVIVGTHALIQQDVAFADLRLAVVDEQHRFGVRERMRLREKGRGVDMLVMTATPIPRSLALSRYGDMDVSVLDEKPPGRRPVSTALVSEGRLDQVVDRLRAALAAGQRAYWVCPLVGESEAVDLTAAERRFEHLRAAFGPRVELVHGQMPPERRDAAMARFKDGAAQILVATTVIEVGVDVPEATIMVVERAEAFGLAQLHQLRGRVGRGAADSFCLLLYRAPLTDTERRRLGILRETEDGFRIAAEDLAIRGAGDLIGTAQSGLPRFRVADLERHAGLMAIAQSDARRLVAEDPDLTGPRGEAARTLLYLFSQDEAIRLLDVG